MSDVLHPLYEAAPAEHKWRRGSLPALLMTLRRQALAAPFDRERSKAEKDWQWYVLPKGAVVGYRIREDMDRRAELRIARKEPAATAAAAGKWEREVAIFLKHFEIRHGDGMTPSPTPGQVWQRLPLSALDIAKGGAVARYIELRMGEISPEKALCYVCLVDDDTKVVVNWWPAGGLIGQRCDRHLGHEPTEGRDRP